ncbi:MAG TPA: O-methyltransferase, partial [Thermoanaerobaculia bacterium]|nr:O-methyltransferase [Thermoanaerobaculia bacterium]
MKDRLDAIIQRTQAQYLDTLIAPRDALLSRMESLAAEEGQPIADPEVAQFLAILVRVRRPRRILEIGTNIGYSVVVMGRECDAGAVLETIEIDERILATAHRFVAEAGIRCRTVFHQGAALEVLPRLEGTFDFVFIDCIKTEYGDYLDLLLPRLEQGAVIVCDNLLWKGEVAKGAQAPNPSALREFNQRLTSDPRLMSIILPLGDGTG